MMRYLANIGTALSVLANSLLGGRSHETLSYRAIVARRAQKRWGSALCAFLDAVDPGHCERTRAFWEDRP